MTLSFKWIYFSPLLAISLSACSALHLHPVDSAPSQGTQCRTLKRQALFLDASAANTNQEQWKVQADREQLREEYHKNNCDKILADENKNSSDSD